MERMRGPFLRDYFGPRQRGDGVQGMVDGGVDGSVTEGVVMVAPRLRVTADENDFGGDKRDGDAGGVKKVIEIAAFTDAAGDIMQRRNGIGRGQRLDEFIAKVAVHFSLHGAAVLPV